MKRLPGLYVSQDALTSLPERQAEMPREYQNGIRREEGAKRGIQGNSSKAFRYVGDVLISNLDLVHGHLQHEMDGKRGSKTESKHSPPLHSTG